MCADVNQITPQALETCPQSWEVPVCIPYSAISHQSVLVLFKLWPQLFPNHKSALPVFALLEPLLLRVERSQWRGFKHLIMTTRQCSVPTSSVLKVSSSTYCLLPIADNDLANILNNHMTYKVKMWQLRSQKCPRFRGFLSTFFCQG